MALPDLKYSISPSRTAQLSFGRIDRTPSGGDGDIYDEENITADDYPTLSLRRLRYTRAVEGMQDGVIGSDGTHLFWSNGSDFYYNGELVAGMTLPTADHTARQYAVLGDRIIVMPDKYYYDISDGSHGSLEASVYVPLTIYPRLTEDREAAVQLELRTSSDIDLTQHFSAGDALTLYFALVADWDYNGTYVVERVTTRSLCFANGTFPSTVGDLYEAGCTVSRDVPDMDYICSVNNRLFGCRDGEIFACKPGDPFNWNAFTGLSTDSYYLDTGSPEPFTACAVCNGRPVFFTETRAITLYGDYPAAFSTSEAHIYGVKDGAWRSVVSFDASLLYLSRYGVVQYTASGTQIISDRLGVHMITGAAGSDGMHYFLSADVGKEVRENYVYNIESGMWSKEDGRSFLSFARLSNGLYGVSGGEICYVSGDATAAPDGYEDEALPVACAIEFAPFREDHSSATIGKKKWARRLVFRFRASDILIQINFVYIRGDGTVSDTVTVFRERYTGEGEHCVTVPVPNNRVDLYRVRLEVWARSDASAFKLTGMAREYTVFN